MSGRVGMSNVMGIFSGQPIPQQQGQQQQAQNPNAGHTQVSSQPNQAGVTVQAGGQAPATWVDPIQNIVNTAKPPVVGNAGAGNGQGGQGQQVQQGQQNELDAYTSLFTMQGNGGEQQTPEALDAPLFSMDNAKVAEAMKGASFTGGLDPQLLQRAMSGDQAAFGDVLNSVARTVMHQSVLMMQNMVQEGVGAYNGRLSKHLPNQFKQFAAKEQIGSKPNMQHGAVQPLLAAVVQQAMNANPNLTVAQATGQAEGYLKAFATHMASTTQSAAQPVDALTGRPAEDKAPQPTNWRSVLG